MTGAVRLIVGDNDIRTVTRSLLEAISQEISVKERNLLKTELPSYEDYLRQFRELEGLRKALKLATNRAESMGLVSSREAVHSEPR
jgi:hypothetical protein